MEYFSSNTRIYLWKFNGISEIIIEKITKSNNLFTSAFINRNIYIYILPEVSFSGHCLTHNNISIPKEVINLCIPYIPNPWFKNLNTDFTLNNCLFGSADLIMNAEQDKYKYSGYMIAF